VGCGSGSSLSREKEGWKEEMGPSFMDVARSGSCPSVTVLPIVGGFPSLFTKVVR
jgi:hypothetical protein